MAPGCRRGKISRASNRLCAAVLTGALAGAARLPAQAPDSQPHASQPQALVYTPGTIQYPTAMKPWSGKMALGASLISMPASIAMSGSQIRWPLIVYEYTLGLPAHFTLATSFSTEIVTNHLEAMPRWQFALSPRLHGDVGLGVAYWWGKTPFERFDNEMDGWMAYPYVGVGYDWGKVALTFQAKTNWILSLHSRSGDLTADYSQNFLSGTSFRLILEQPIWKHTTLGFALQASYVKFYYPQWPLFPTFDHYFWIPEAQFYFTL
jgi:hypothetical protein